MNSEHSAEAILSESPEAWEDLQTLRNELDQIDEHLVQMLARRFMITDMVGALKSKHSLPAFDPDREARMKERYKELAEEQGMDPRFVAKVFSTILQESVANHKKIAQDPKAQEHDG